MGAGGAGSEDGIVAALLGTALANAVSSSDTAGIDWIEVLFQVVLAVIGVTLAARTLGEPGEARARP